MRWVYTATAASIAANISDYLARQVVADISCDTIEFQKRVFEEAQKHAPRTMIRFVDLQRKIANEPYKYPIQIPPKGANDWGVSVDGTALTLTR